MPAGGRAFVALFRNLCLALLLYGVIYYTIQFATTPRAFQRAKGQLLHTIAEAVHHDGQIESTSDGQVKIILPNSQKTVKIHPHANAYNRPPASVEIHDGYLGERPDVDTEADIPKLVETCRGTYHGLERMRDVASCLAFLRESEDQYYYLPELQDRASRQDPRQAEYLEADGRGNTLKRYPSYKAVSLSDLGQCNGPVVPYHVYWSGPATWRVEVFIKSYLHTQNLPCSRLWLWLDADRDPAAVHNFLNSDPLFARFLPLVQRGDIKVLSWNFPTRMPLPAGFDHTDGIGYYPDPGPYNTEGERAVADGIIENTAGQKYIQLKETQMTFFAQAISDAVRFVILHLHGGLYLDMDVLLIRDMRPLLIPRDHSFAERWAAHPHPGDYNTAILSLTANSSLSSYLLRGGVRMGLNFHPRVIGRMAWKDGRDRELSMLETAAFDPIWTEFNGDRQGRCTIPCVKDYSQVFKGTKDAIKQEWKDLNEARLAARSIQPIEDGEFRVLVDESSEPLHSFSSTSEEVDALKNAGIVADYQQKSDKYPPNNRTMENFFRGAWTYHIHNQWMKHPEPSSWLAALQSAHDRFFDGGVNPYNEHWQGPRIEPYNKWTEFL